MALQSPLTLTSMEVRFFLLRPCAAILSMLVGLPEDESASSNHLFNKGFSLHMFLKLSCRASNLQMVVCENTLPYRVPSAQPHVRLGKSSRSAFRSDVRWFDPP